MWKEVKSSLIMAIITMIITGIVAFIISVISEPSVKVVQGYFQKNDGNYINSILIKNIKKDEYLKEIDVIIDSNINVYNVEINGQSVQIENNNIKIDSIKPENEILILVNTNLKLDNKNVHYSKNGQKFDVSYFNEYKNLSKQTLIIILIYAGIDFVYYLFQGIRCSKIKKENDEKYQKLEFMQDENEKSLVKLIKKSNIEKQLYIKEMADMEKEIEFYKQIIINNCNEKITKEQLENLISSKLKTFSKKKFQNLTYDDVYSIILSYIEEK